MRDVTSTPWPIKPLGNLCRIEIGSTPARNSAALWDPKRETENVWLSIADLPKRLHALATDSKEHVSDLAAKGMRRIPKGTLLVSFKLTLGRLAYAGRDLFSNEAIASLLDIDEEQISKQFLYWSLTAFDWDKASEGDQKVKGKTLNKAKLKIIPISLPPLEEQQRIVAVLDETFEGLARARAHAEANLQNARELFKSYAGSVFRPYEDAEESAYATTVGAVCDIQSGAGFPLQYQGEKSGDFPFYKVSDMNLPGNEWELHAANHYVSDKVRLELRARIFPRDSIVFPKVGGAIATNKKRIIKIPGCVDNNVMGLIPDQGKVVPEYLHEWLRAFDIYEFSNKANPPSITQGTVSGWPLRVPSRDEQMQVVATAVGLREHTEILRKKYIERLQDIASLRQSLLQKAFTGELT